MTPRTWKHSVLLTCALVLTHIALTTANSVSTAESIEETKSDVADSAPRRLAQYHNTGVRARLLDETKAEIKDRHPVEHRNRRKHRHDQKMESEHKKEEVLSKHKKVHNKDILYQKKYFDDNPIARSKDAAVQPGCEEGLANCELEVPVVVSEDKPRAAGHKRRQRRQAPFQQYRNTWRNANASPPVASSNYQVDPCLRIFGYRCDQNAGNQYYQTYNSNWRPVQIPAVPQYYLPVPYPQQQWVSRPVQPFNFYPNPNVPFNPGYPPMNPPLSPYPPAVPSYNDKPNDPPTPKPGVVVGDRFGLDDFDDDRPSWGAVDTATQRPNAIGNDVRPTRRPAPPLRHDRPTTATPITLNNGRDLSNPPSNSLSVNDYIQDVPTRRPSFPGKDVIRKPMRRPTPPLRHERPSPQGAPDPTDGRTIARPQLNSISTADGNYENYEPRACTWAIVSCCNPRTNEVRLNCFEQLGCPGPFWDKNPCSRDIAQKAIDAANNY